MERCSEGTKERWQTSRVALSPWRWMPAPAAGQKNFQCEVRLRGVPCLAGWLPRPTVLLHTLTLHTFALSHTLFIISAHALLLLSLSPLPHSSNPTVIIIHSHHVSTPQVILLLTPPAAHCSHLLLSHPSLPPSRSCCNSSSLLIRVFSSFVLPSFYSYHLDYGR